MDIDAIHNTFSSLIPHFPAIELGYLFGSVATYSEGPLSDVDFGIYFDSSQPLEGMGRLQLEILDFLIEQLGIDKIDITVMNYASVETNFEIIKCNHPLYVKDEEQRIEFEYRVHSMYLDRRYFNQIFDTYFLETLKHRGLTF